MKIFGTTLKSTKKITYDVICYDENYKKQVFDVGIKVKKEAFELAKYYKKSNKYETVIVQKLDNEEIIDEWFIK